jgi:hypothetical protein
MHSQTIIQIVSLKALILVDYIIQLKSRRKIQPIGDIYGVVIVISKRGLKEVSS